MDKLNDISDRKAHATGTENNRIVSLPRLGDIVRIDVAPVTIDKEPCEHVGFVSQRWKSGKGTVQAIVKIIGSVHELNDRSAPRSFFRNAKFLTAPYNMLEGTTFEALAPADKYTRRLVA